MTNCWDRSFYRSPVLHSMIPLYKKLYKVICSSQLQRYLLNILLTVGIITLVLKECTYVISTLFECILSVIEPWLMFFSHKTIYGTSRSTSVTVVHTKTSHKTSFTQISGELNLNFRIS